MIGLREGEEEKKRGRRREGRTYILIKNTFPSVEVICGTIEVSRIVKTDLHILRSSSSILIRYFDASL